MFSCLGLWLIAADYFSFPKLLAASVEHMLLQCFSLAVIAEVMFCMEMQQARSKDITAAHSTLVRSSNPALARFSPLGSAIVNLGLLRVNQCSAGKPSA